MSQAIPRLYQPGIIGVLGGNSVDNVVYIFTIEQLAQVSDVNTQQMRGLMDLKQKALAFLDRAEASVTHKELDETKAQLAALQAQMADLQGGVATGPGDEDELEGKQETKPATRRRNRKKVDDGESEAEG